MKSFLKNKTNKNKKVFEWQVKEWKQNLEHMCCESPEAITQKCHGSLHDLRVALNILTSINVRTQVRGMKALGRKRICMITGQARRTRWRGEGSEDQVEGREWCAVPPFVSAMESIAVRKIRYPSFQELVCAGWYNSRGWDRALGMNFIVSCKWFI